MIYIQENEIEVRQILTVDVNKTECVLSGFAMCIWSNCKLNMNICMWWILCSFFVTVGDLCGLFFAWWKRAHVEKLIYVCSFSVVFMAYVIVISVFPIEFSQPQYILRLWQLPLYYVYIYLEYQIAVAPLSRCCRTYYL